MADSFGAAGRLNEYRVNIVNERVPNKIAVHFVCQRSQTGTCPLAKYILHELEG